MKAVVHLGLNKTGTTTIQRWLMVNRRKLRKQGLQYERFDNKYWFHPTNQGELVAVVYAQLQTFLPFERIRKNIGFQNFEEQAALSHRVAQAVGNAAKKTKNGTYVISCELLGSLLTTGKQIKALDDWLTTLFSDVRYVMYLRDPETWLVSRYTQSVVDMKNPESLKDFITRRPYAGYRPLLERWRKTIDKARFDLRIFDEKWKSEDGLIDDFANAMCINNHQLKPVRMSNISPSNEGIQARQNNTISRPLNVKTRNRMARLSSFLKKDTLKNTGTTVKLTAEQRLMVWNKNHDDISWVMKTFFAGKASIFEDRYFSATASSQVPIVHNTQLTSG